MAAQIHYVQAISSRVRQDGKNVFPFAKILFVLTDGSAKLPIFTDEALTIPAANPVVCDENGRSEFWYDDVNSVGYQIQGGTRSNPDVVLPAVSSESIFISDELDGKTQALPLDMKPTLDSYTINKSKGVAYIGAVEYTATYVSDQILIDGTPLFTQAGITDFDLAFSIDEEEMIVYELADDVWLYWNKIGGAVTHKVSHNAQNPWISYPNSESGNIISYEFGKNIDALKDNVEMLIHGEGFDGDTELYEESGAAVSVHGTPNIKASGSFSIPAIDFTDLSTSFSRSIIVGNGEFVFEANVSILSAISTPQNIFTIGAGATSLSLYMPASTPALYLAVGNFPDGQTTLLIISESLLGSKNVMLKRTSGGVLQVWINGILQGSDSTVMADWSSAVDVNIGAYNTTAVESDFNGYMRNIRITVGADRTATSDIDNIEPLYRRVKYKSTRDDFVGIGHAASLEGGGVISKAGMIEVDDWTPLDLIVSPKLYVNGSSIAGTAPVLDSWDDLSPSPIDVENFSGVDKGEILTSLWSGNDVVSLGQTAGKILTMPPGKSIGRNAYKIWFFCVAQFQTTSGTATLFQLNTTGGTGRFTVVCDGSRKLYMIARRNDADPASPLPSPVTAVGTNIFMAYGYIDLAVNPPRLGVHINGTEDYDIEPVGMTTGLFADTEHATSILTIGGPVGGGSTQGAYYERFIMGDGSVIPTQKEIDKMFGQAAHDNGIESVLPANHPYKDQPPKIDRYAVEFTGAVSAV